MVSFFDTYSGEEFKKFAASLPLPEIVQPSAAQLETANEIVQLKTAQFLTRSLDEYCSFVNLKNLL